jgi:hypothetical protein
MSSGISVLFLKYILRNNNGLKKKFKRETLNLKKKFKTNAILIREILQQWTTFFFFEKTTHFNAKLYLGFKPHFS